MEKPFQGKWWPHSVWREQPYVLGPRKKVHWCVRLKHFLFELWLCLRHSLSVCFTSWADIILATSWEDETRVVVLILQVVETMAWKESSSTVTKRQIWDSSPGRLAPRPECFPVPKGRILQIYQYLLDRSMVETLVRGSCGFFSETDSVNIELSDQALFISFEAHIWTFCYAKLLTWSSNAKTLQHNEHIAYIYYHYFYWSVIYCVIWFIFYWSWFTRLC